MYNPSGRDILQKFIQYIKFTDPTIFIKLFVFDMSLTDEDINTIFGSDVTKKNINQLVNELKGDGTKLITEYKAAEHSTDKNTIPQVPEFIMDSILNLSFSQKGSLGYENALQPCILVFVIDLMMRRVLDYEHNVILPDAVRKLNKELGIHKKFAVISNDIMEWCYNIISEGVESVLGYNILIIEEKIKELLDKINIRQDIKSTLSQRVGYWKSQESNLIDRTIKGI